MPAIYDSFRPGGISTEQRMMTSLRLFVALCAAVVWAESCSADCSSLHALAQEHANDMARRNSLDHAGFMLRRGPRGAVAENVAMGCDTEVCARRMWMQSPPHRANMMLGGCQAVASAVSATGRRYWAMEIGGKQSCHRPSAWRHCRSSRPQRQRSRWRCRSGLLHRWKQRAVSARQLSNRVNRQVNVAFDAVSVGYGHVRYWMPAQPIDATLA